MVERGLKNYWGYNSIGFFAPAQRYSAIGSISEFKTMVKILHNAGIKVILEVVYNHSPEGNPLGATLMDLGRLLHSKDRNADSLRGQVLLLQRQLSPQTRLINLDDRNA